MIDFVIEQTRLENKDSDMLIMFISSYMLFILSSVYLGFNNSFGQSYLFKSENLFRVSFIKYRVNLKRKDQKYTPVY